MQTEWLDRMCPPVQNGVEQPEELEHAMVAVYPDELLIVYPDGYVVVLPR